MNKMLLEILQRNFNLPNLKMGRGNIEFDYKDEHILCGIQDETKNGYVFFDYKVWYWSKGDYEKIPNRLGRGKDLALYKEMNLEERLVDFFKKEVLCEDESFIKQDFTKNWKNFNKPVFEDQVVVQTCIEPESEEKKSDEPMTLFDFM